MSIRRIARHAIAVLGAAGSVVALAASPGHASWNSVDIGSSDVNMRDCYHPLQTPSTNCNYVTTVPHGTTVHLVCQKAGQTIGDDSVWDYVVWDSNPSRPEGFVADWYVNTHTSSYWVPGVDHCS
jgi:hypothetical protein